MKRLTMLLLMITSIATAYTQNVTALTGKVSRAEYFIDADPGPGNGIMLPVATAADSLRLSATIPLQGLTGFHLLLIRVADDNGRWSMPEGRGFYVSTATANEGMVTAAEYYIDTDPGTGKGTALSTGSSDSIVRFTAVIPASLTAGFHFLAIRTRDTDGKWSLAETRTFYFTSGGADLPDITAAEYFYDTDPGAGKGNTLAVTTPGVTVTQNFLVPVPAQLSQGNHLLAIRVRNRQGTWSLVETDTVTVGAVSTITCPKDTMVSAATGDCTAMVTNIDPAVPPGTGYSYTLSGATTGSGTGTASGHTFNAGTTTVTYAYADSTSGHCSFNVTVQTNTAPSVTISTPYTSICSGMEVLFNAVPVNGGPTPSYQWKRNGVAVGTNSDLYSDSTLNDGDSITVEMISSLTCAGRQPVRSPALVMKVTPTLTPEISISASATTICPGQQVSFTAKPVNAGSTPTFIWRVNNHAVGSDSTGYQSSTLQNGDTVSVLMFSSTPCFTNQVAESNFIIMTVQSSVTPSVSIAASETNICSGQQVSFTATPTNGGSNPAYEWTVNNNAVGSNSNSFQSTTLANGDIVKVTMSSSLGCAVPSLATSNSISISVGPGSRYYRDNDGDGYGDPGNSVLACSAPHGYVTDNTDCNDSNNAIHPGATEICNGLDDNCDGQVDEGVQKIFYRDIDGDGYGNAGSGSIPGCSAPAGYVSDSTDCDDHNAAVHPGQAEICGNGIDDNCNGLVDEGCTPVSRIPVLQLRTYPVKEGDTGIKILSAQVTLDTIATEEAMVYYSTADGDARAGTDYVAASGWLHFPAGSSTAILPLKIIGDLVREGNERFTILFSQPSGLVLSADPKSTVMIIDDDHHIAGGFATKADPGEGAPLIIPTTVRRNQVWNIPQIGQYRNEVLISDAQGQLINRLVNYHNQVPIGNIALGLYFYQVRVTAADGSTRIYSGRLFVSE